MDEITPLPSEPVPDLQRTVQRKLGRCMLQLQQYERLLKAMVAHSELSGPAERLQELRDEKVACAHKKTLGTLVGMLTESYLKLPDLPDTQDQPEADNGDRMWFSFRYQMELPEERYVETKAALKELVDLRNELVHHFLQRFDLWAVDGCVAAETYLDESYETIHGHYLTLRDWAKSMDEARQLMVSFMQTKEYEDAVLNGIWVDGTVHWPSSGITACLREAETKLAQAGWTPLFEAIHWIAKTYPEQTPKRYGCGSWRHVIHESQQFEIRKQSQADNGATVVWYRSRPRETSKEQE
ncbi:MULTISPECIES: OST-HTH/LOTUS domain-containing protein [Metapseudomonas]|uniref:OST-HTH/LOTUS domain-containing protein n=1 Tax=Metapseudomonas boanensis TaxID=2822138 RepID=A0ABS5XM06_9GAMM|nr:OST-HTH/LOTUS domain-containing protein [Pseudomonas boanensis]MBT8767312.1 OST-HTH/LOTUS domain-containing protein [Pseudomonas boanensis]